MDISIRKLTPEDYPVITRIGNAVMPDYPTTEAEVRRGDEVRDPKCHHVRLIAERSGSAVGYVAFGNSEWMYHPQRFMLDVQVLPEHRKQGIGAALYDAALQEIAPNNPTVLRSHSREDMPDSIRFLEKRGYVEEERDWESRLDVASFDPAPYCRIDAQMRALGIEFATLADLANDPDRDTKMYALETVLARDLPAPDPLSDLSYEQYRKHILDSPNLLPEAWTVAMHKGEYIGVSVVWRAPGQDYLDTGLTAVRRDWRRHGIALAMKLRVLAYAREEGYREIRTDNESNNVGMLTINERLGFVKQPVWIGFKRTLEAHTETTLP